MGPDLVARLAAGEILTRSLRGQSLWRLSGPDRVRYLNGQVTCDVTGLADGEVRLAAVCTAKGRMEGLVHIGSHGEEFFLDADPSLRESLGPRLEKYLIADDAVFEDATELWSLSHIFGSNRPDLPPTAFAFRHHRYGIPGHDVWIPGGGAVVAGQLVEEERVEILRMEHAIPRWGADLTPQSLPPEGGPIMLDSISYTKGCYVGQETIARLKSVGHVNRTLVLMRAVSAEFPAPGTRLVAGGKEIGAVTSAGYSPTMNGGMALGYVPPALAAEGTVLRAGELELTVSQPLKTTAAS